STHASHRKPGQASVCWSQNGAPARPATNAPTVTAQPPAITTAPVRRTAPGPRVVSRKRRRHRYQLAVTRTASTSTATRTKTMTTVRSSRSSRCSYVLDVPGGAVVPVTVSAVPSRLPCGPAQCAHPAQPDDPDDRPQYEGDDGEQQVHPEVRGRVAVLEREPAAVLGQVLDESDPDDPAPHPEGEQEPGHGAAELHDSRPFLTTPGSRSRPGLRDPSPGRAHPSSIATGCPDPCAGWDPGGDVTGRGRYVSDRVRTPEDRRTFAVGHVRRPAVHRP